MSMPLSESIIANWDIEVEVRPAQWINVVVLVQSSQKSFYTYSQSQHTKSYRNNLGKEYPYSFLRHSRRLSQYRI